VGSAEPALCSACPPPPESVEPPAPAWPDPEPPAPAWPDPELTIANLPPIHGTELACAGRPRLDELGLFDAYEQRFVCVHYNTAVVAASGPSCSATACAEAVTSADAERRAQLASARGSCTTYWIGMQGDQLAFAGTPAELVAPLLPIDTLDEALLWLDKSCTRAWSGNGGFVILDVNVESHLLRNECYYDLIDTQLWHVASDGSRALLDQTRVEWMSGCIGRRPHGLRSARGGRGVSAIGEYCARSAELEAASVVAFLELARSLREHGAPGSLVERATRAARDEIRHARTMTRLARRHGAEPRPRRIDAHAGASLEALATENAVEGCVVETWGALVGSVQARQAASASLRAKMRRIAADETRHAALSWDLARWFDSQLDAPARARVATARKHAVAQLLAAAQREPEASLRAELGLPSASTAKRLAQGLAATLWQSQARLA
jgi:hypothetical protein